MVAPKLTPELAAQLALIPTSGVGTFRYAPCRVRLRSGSTLPRVYLAEESSYIRNWGRDPARASVDLKEIESIEDSLDRLPARLADQIYEAGESGMGYVIFTVRFRDGCAIPFMTGNAVDFPDWPSGINPRDAIAVEPHLGREEFGREDGLGRPGASYLWCLYTA